MATVLDRPRPDRQQGVFETLLIADGRAIELDAHLARLATSLEALFPDRLPPDPAKEIQARVQGLALGSVRFTVAPVGNVRLEIEIAVREVDRNLVFPAAPVALHGFVMDGGLGAHKWADRTLLDEAQAGLSPDTLPIVVDRDGTVLEASRANVFVGQDGVLVTPFADDRILPGITRARVMEVAAAAEIETREAEIYRDDLLAADEVFLTSSVRGVERVRAFDDAKLTTGGEIGSLIAAELRRTWIGD